MRVHACIDMRVHVKLQSQAGLCFRKGKRAGSSLGKVGSSSPVPLSHVIGQVRYGRGRKGNTQVLEAEPSKPGIFAKQVQTSAKTGVDTPGLHRLPADHRSLWRGLVVRLLETAQCSSEDPAKPGLESKRGSQTQRVSWLSAPYNLLVLCFQTLDSKDLGLYDFSMNNGQWPYPKVD